MKFILSLPPMADCERIITDLMNNQILLRPVRSLLKDIFLSERINKQH